MMLLEPPGETRHGRARDAADDQRRDRYRNRDQQRPDGRVRIANTEQACPKKIVEDIQVIIPSALVAGY